MPDSTSAPRAGRLRLPRLGITAQVYVGVLLLALSLLVVTAAAWLDAGAQARARADREIGDALLGFESDYARATRDLAALGAWLVAQNDLADLVQARDSARLARYLAPWTEVSLADSITVTDERGTALSQVKTGQPFTQGTSVIDLPGVRDALSGKRASTLDQDATGRLEGRLALPIYADPQSRVAGVLILGFYIDGSFLQYRTRRPDQEIGLVTRDQLAIVTLTDQQGAPWQGKPVPAAVLAAERERRPSDLVVISTEVGPYLFRFKPLEGLAGARLGMYGVGLSMTTLDAERLTLFRTFGLGVVGVALAMGVIGFLFARQLMIPIRVLDGAARGMAKGDLSRPISLAREDELGDLARQMDSMRTQLAAALHDTQLEKSRYAAVIQYMGAAALVTDRSFAIAAVNPAAENLLRQNHADLTGKLWEQVFVNADREGQERPQALMVSGNGNGLAAHERFKIPARPDVVLDVISTEVQVDGQPAGHVHILQDASAGDRLIRAQDEFIMNAAHELRGPLASLRASIELLVEDYAVMSKQDLGVMLRTMQRAVVKFQGLVENLVDIGSMQARRFRVRPLPIRLEAVVEDAVEQVRPLLQAREQRAEVRIECQPACLVMADRARITQVLINLLTNASKYGPEQQPIEVQGLDGKDSVRVEVTDHGLGIDPKEQASLFQRFYRGRRAEEEGIGIGLGLAMAREIIEAHGGEIGVRSQKGEGATFWFTLRKADPAQKEEGG